MDKNKKTTVWLPVGIALGIALGIFIGNHYRTIAQKGHRFYGGGGKLDAVMEIINEQYVDTIDTWQLAEEAIPKILGGLDPHTVYIPAEDVMRMNEDLEGSFSGIGVSFNMQTDTILVVNVVPGGPSEKAGIRAFDRIITIDDSLYAGRKIDQERIKETLRGTRNSTVRLGVKRRNETDLLYFDVTRGDVPVKSVDAAYKVNEGTGYIKVGKFGRTTYNEFITAIAQLKQQGCTSFVVDLRGNVGGYMDAAVNMVNEFMPKGHLIVYAEGRAFPRDAAYSNGTGTCQDAPLVVLTDETSASASEIFSGAIQDNDRGIIVGRRTFGKGLVQSPIRLSDGSEIRLTVARYYTPSGRCIQKKYTSGEDNDYDYDIIRRFEHGEFDSADSIKMDGNQKYETVGGRTVYGGGGIMPDVFIPRDTSGVTSYFSQVLNSGTLNLYALEYSDCNCDNLSSFKNYEELYAYLQQQPLLEDFVRFAAKHGIKKRPRLISISSRLIEKQLQAYIVQNFFGDAGFYPVFLSDDATLKRAVEVIKESKPLSPSAELNN